MRGKADNSDTYPFRVREVAAVPTISPAGYRVFNVAKQEFVDDIIHPNEACAIGAAANAKKVHDATFGK